MDFDVFLSKCVACGGNWNLMILSGIKEVYPRVYEDLDSEKEYTFVELVEILKKEGVVF